MNTTEIVSSKWKSLCLFALGLWLFGVTLFVKSNLGSIVFGLSTVFFGLGIVVFSILLL